MNTEWTEENLEELARSELGADLAAAADLFPRVVFATYSQMVNSHDSDNLHFNGDAFRKTVAENIPKSLTEVLPFFVRNVWNRKWTFATHEREITSLAKAYAELLAHTGTSVSKDDLVEECRRSFSGIHL